MSATAAAFDQFLQDWIEQLLHDVPADQREAVLREHLACYLRDDRDVIAEWFAIGHAQEDEARATAR